MNYSCSSCRTDQPLPGLRDGCERIAEKAIAKRFGRKRGPLDSQPITNKPPAWNYGPLLGGLICALCAGMAISVGLWIWRHW